MLETILAEKAARVERFLDSHFAESRTRDSHPGLRELLASVRYSALGGGKRFRPALAMLTAEALGQSAERVLPFAASVECIHTYSLIHDDLPCMDNDDFRRGKPTNHKSFGEATALLAGDALLTEAFAISAAHYDLEPAAAIRAIRELAQAAGLFGMVGGQAMDMNSKVESISLKDLETMHRLKTGALIKVAAVGAAILCFADEQRRKEIESYAADLGLAFQVADDLLDNDPRRPEPGSYPALLGEAKTRDYLERLTESCLNALGTWPSSADPLRELARYNRRRLL